MKNVFSFIAYYLLYTVCLFTFAILYTVCVVRFLIFHLLLCGEISASRYPNEHYKFVSRKE